MKKIVLFSDGTGNSSSNPHKTNVWRAYQALDRTPGSRQIAFYDNGVGTSRFTPTAMLGLAFGWGLARNVRQIYGFLCRTYEPGDKIYGFGFSRGAFTIRVVMGLIASQGIINWRRADNDADLDRLIVAAYRTFRRKEFPNSFLSFFLRRPRDELVSVWHWMWGRQPYDPELNLEFSDDKENPPPIIEFVGVWDTVDAYGLPVDELTRAWDKVIWPLTAKDRNLSKRIKRARHALALDEQRESFEPMLWNEEGGDEGDERILQVWFPGVHSNVGGGYPDESLAFIPLNWMIEESTKNNGLKYHQSLRDWHAEQANHNGPLYDSRGGVGNFYRYLPRHLDYLCQQEKPGLWARLKSIFVTLGEERNVVNIRTAKIHHSVFDRVRHAGDYAPLNLPASYVVIDAKGKQHRLPEKSGPRRLLAETVGDACRRREDQAVVWNRVWARKLLYYATLLLLLAFLFYPYAPFDRDAGIYDFMEPILGSFSFLVPELPKLVNRIPGLGFAEGWATRYASYPYVFTIGLVAIGVMLALGARMRRSISSRMRTHWYHLSGGPPPRRPASGFSRWLARILDDTCDEAGKLMRSAGNRASAVFRILLEAVTVLAFVALVLSVTSRTFLTVADMTGAICDPDRSRETNTFGDTFTFDPRNPCLDTDLKLVRNTRYRIEVQLKEGWKDKTIEADLTGWRSAPWYLYLATPMRRHLFEPWYQPIARVDDELFDRHPLRPETVSRLEDAPPVTDLDMEFKARRDGRLYLYVNDAVFFLPGVIKRYYNNNDGHACVRVTKVKPKDDAAAQTETDADGTSADPEEQFARTNAETDDSSAGAGTTFDELTCDAPARQ